MPSPPDFAAQCALAKGGPKLEFMQARIWRWLKRNGPASRSAVARAMRITDNGASQALIRMRATGHAVKMGATRKALWEATGDAAPVCTWGMHKNSLAQLAKNWGNWYENLVAANQKTGPPPPRRPGKPPARPLPKVDPHPLSMAWTISTKSDVDTETM